MKYAAFNCILTVSYYWVYKTYWFWIYIVLLVIRLFFFLGDTHICDVELAYQPSVKFCQKGNANGRTIFITSGAQKYANAKCLCEVKADPESSDIFASYMLQLETSNCGLKIIIIDVDQVFSCNKTEANLQSNSTKFYLHKTENNTADIIAAGMCLRISIGMLKILLCML